MAFAPSLPSFLILMLASSFALAVPLGSGPSSLPPPRSAASANSPADSDYQAGIQKFADNDYAGAEQDFNNAIEKHPGHAYALLGLAEIAFKKNQPDEAASLIHEAAKSAPEDAYVQSSLGRYLAMQQQYPAAESALKKAMALDVGLVRPRMDLADLYASALRKPEAAIPLYQEVLEIDPNHAGAHYAYGITQMRLGDMAEAKAALEASASLEPGNPLPPLALARLSMQNKQLNDANMWVERSLTIHPTLADALEFRGDIKQARNLPDQALADYSAAFRAQPKQVSAILKEASLLQILGRQEEAFKAYQAAIELDPKQAIAYNNLAWMAAESGNHLDQAEAWGRMAVELQPNVADFQDTLGWVYRARGKLDDAEQALLLATSISGAPASAFYHLGVVQQELGKTSQALEAYKKAVALDKGHQEAERALRSLEEL